MDEAEVTLRGSKEQVRCVEDKVSEQGNQLLEKDASSSG